MRQYVTACSMHTQKDWPTPPLKRKEVFIFIAAQAVAFQISFNGFLWNDEDVTYLKLCHIIYLQTYKSTLQMNLSLCSYLFAYMAAPLASLSSLFLSKFWMNETRWLLTNRKEHVGDGCDIASSLSPALHRKDMVRIRPHRLLRDDWIVLSNHFDLWPTPTHPAHPPDPSPFASPPNKMTYRSYGSSVLVCQKP